MLSNNSSLLLPLKPLPLPQAMLLLLPRRRLLHLRHKGNCTNNPNVQSIVLCVASSHSKRVSYVGSMDGREGVSCRRIRLVCYIFSDHDNDVVEMMQNIVTRTRGTSRLSSSHRIPLPASLRLHPHILALLLTNLLLLFALLLHSHIRLSEDLQRHSAQLRFVPCDGWVFEDAIADFAQDGFDLEFRALCR